MANHRQNLRVWLPSDRGQINHRFHNVLETRHASLPQALAPRMASERPPVAILRLGDPDDESESRAGTVSEHESGSGTGSAAGDDTYVDSGDEISEDFEADGSTEREDGESEESSGISEAESEKLGPCPDSRFAEFFKAAQLNEAMRPKQYALYRCMLPLYLDFSTLGIEAVRDMFLGVVVDHGVERVQRTKRILCPLAKRAVDGIIQLKLNAKKGQKPSAKAQTHMLTVLEVMVFFDYAFEYLVQVIEKRYGKGKIDRQRLEKAVLWSNCRTKSLCTLVESLCLFDLEREEDDYTGWKRMRFLHAVGKEEMESLSDHLKKEPIKLGNYFARYGGDGIYFCVKAKMQAAFGPEVLPTHIGPRDNAMASDMVHWRGVNLMLLLDSKRHFLKRTDPELDPKAVFPKRTGNEKCCKRKRTGDVESSGKKKGGKKARSSDDKSWSPSESEIEDEFELIDFTSEEALNESEDDVAKQVFGGTSLYYQQLEIFQRCEENGHKVPNALRKSVLKFLYYAV